MTLETTNAAPSRRRASRRGTGVDGARPYDFRRPTKLSREHVRALQVGYETYARQCTTLITSTLRVVGQMSLVSVEQLTYEEYVNTLSTPTVMAMLSLEPIQGTGLLEMSLGSAMTTVDHLLGGAGGPDQPNRTPTDLEEPLLRRFIGRMLQEFRYAFSSLVDWHPAVTAVEYNPQFAQVASASDVMIAASFDLKIGVVESTSTVCLPFAPVLPLLEAATGRAPATEHQKRQREQAARLVNARLAEVPVTVGIDVGATTLTPAQVLRLRVGDVIPLQHSLTAPMRVTAAGVTFAHAVPGTRGKRLACLVVPQPEEAPSR